MKSYEVITPDSLFSWLTSLHIECMSESEYMALRHIFENIDIQSKKGQLEVIDRTILPEYQSLNEVSKNALKKILATAISKFSEKDLEKVFWDAGLPFKENILNKREFLTTVWQRIFVDEDVSAFSQK